MNKCLFSFLCFACWILQVFSFGQEISSNSAANSSTSDKVSSKKKSAPTVSSVLAGNASQLVQFESQIHQIQGDPYPLETYSGQFLSEDIGVIREQFTAKNLPVVKATLEKWLQKRDSSFPIEGYFMLAAIYDQLQCYPQALSVLGDGEVKATEESVKMSFLTAQAKILRHSGRNEESISLFSGISAKEILLYPEIFLNQGMSYLYLANYDQAIINFRKYLNLVPDGPQSSNIRRAIAWLLLARSGQVSAASPVGSVPAVGGSNSKEQNLEAMLQLLVQKQVATDFGELNKSTTPKVNDKALNLAQKDLEDLERYSNIAD